MSFNKVILTGNIGEDLKINESEKGKAINFSIAVNNSYTTKEGEKVDAVDWFRVTAFGKLAELCSNYLSKGSKVLIEGKLKNNKWNDKDGNTKYSTEVYAESVEFLSPKKED